MKNYNNPYFGVIQAMTSTLPQGDATTPLREQGIQDRAHQRIGRINPLRLLGVRR